MNYKDELYHFGVIGMRWGRRKSQSEMKKQAENVLGRKIGYKDFGNKITNKGIKKVKYRDDLEKKYNKIKKKEDPVFDYLDGYNVGMGTGLNLRKVKKLVSKLEKNPNYNVNKGLKIELGKKVLAKTAFQAALVLTVTEIAKKYS